DQQVIVDRRRVRRDPERQVRRIGRRIVVGRQHAIADLVVAGVRRLRRHRWGRAGGEEEQREGDVLHAREETAETWILQINRFYRCDRICLWLYSSSLISRTS